jgi:hypothetical protein
LIFASFEATKNVRAITKLLEPYVEVDFLNSGRLFD